MTKRKANNRVSVIIPARKELYLAQTCADVLANSAGDIEIIVVLDGFDHYEMPAASRRIKYVQLDGIRGRRAACNAGFDVSTGKYIAKMDAHCRVGEGWDEILKADCEDNWIMIPTRYWLKPETWEIDKARGSETAMQLLYPYLHPYRPQICGRIWEARAAEMQDVMVCEDMSFQGSMYFMTRSHWERLGPQSERGYGTFGSEPEELGLKTQLGPWEGKVVRDKRTWYAHWGKPNVYWIDPDKYSHITRDDLFASFAYAFDFWFNNKWRERKHDFKWLVDKFWPIPGWPEDWLTRRPRKL
jgi:glycosyltransferase involved in cell wall biosynthesis